MLSANVGDVCTNNFIANGFLTSDCECKTEDLEVFIPNIFSPNNDGLNDSFRIYGDKNDIDEVEVFKIYSRWGELIYERYSIEKNEAFWNAKQNGQLVQDGSYLYFIKMKFTDGTAKVYTGSVLVLK